MTKNGTELQEDEMIITSENNVFYITEKPYAGAFVTVKGSTITGYPDISSLTG